MRYFYAVSACIVVFIAFIMIKVVLINILGGDHSGNLRGAIPNAIFHVIWIGSLLYTIRGVWRNIIVNEENQDTSGPSNNGTHLSISDGPSLISSNNDNAFDNNIYLKTAKDRTIIEKEQKEETEQTAKALYNIETKKEANEGMYSEEKYFAIALKEIKADKALEGLWAMALAYGDGNLDKSNAYYIRERVRQLMELHKIKLIKRQEKEYKKYQSSQIDESIEENDSTVSIRNEPPNVPPPVWLIPLIIAIYSVVFILLVIYLLNS